MAKTGSSLSQQISIFFTSRSVVHKQVSCLSASLRPDLHVPGGITNVDYMEREMECKK